MDKSKLLNQIETLIVEKNYISARKLIRNDLKRMGSKFEYYFYMGVASLNFDERLKCFEKAYSINPNNIDIVINLANVKDELGFYEEAIEGYNKALELDPNNALVLNNRGFTYFHQGDFEKALNDYNNALVLAPKLKIAEYNKQELIKILENDKKYSSLIKKFDSHKEDFKHYLNLGIQEMNLGSLNEASLAFDKSIELKQDNSTAYMFKGVIEFQKEDYKKAYEFYTKSIEINNKMIDAYFNRAQIVFATKTENKDELLKALNDLKKSVQLDDKFINAYYSMAVIYKNLKEYKKSIDALNKILEIDEQSVNARALKKLILNKYLN